MLTLTEVRNLLMEIYDRLSFLKRRGILKFFSSELDTLSIDSNDVFYQIKNIFLEPYENKLFSDSGISGAEKLEILEEYSYVFSEIERIVKEFLKIKKAIEGESQNVGLRVTDFLKNRGGV